jgi:hypothetical protein
VSRSKKSWGDVGLYMLKRTCLSFMIGSTVFMLIREARAIVNFLAEEED